MGITIERASAKLQAPEIRRENKNIFHPKRDSSVASKSQTARQGSRGVNTLRTGSTRVLRLRRRWLGCRYASERLGEMQRVNDTSSDLKRV
jgi:hypothetical protein